MGEIKIKVRDLTIWYRREDEISVDNIIKISMDNFLDPVLDYT